MKLRGLIGTLAVMLAIGCSSAVKENTAAQDGKMMAERLKMHGQVSSSEAVMLDAQGEDYFVWKYHNRLFVIGDPETSANFQKMHHLPLTKTVLGAGPSGETVVFEVNKKDDAFADRLKERFENTPFLMETEGDDYNVWQYQGRIFVIGNKNTNEKFKALHHLPYTKTILGAGPRGETVVFEEDPKNPEFAEQLKSKYENTPVLLKAEGNNYFIWKYRNRIYVIGNEKTHESFKTTHHFPFTRTVLGAGPNGETVIFEVDAKNKDLADQLQMRYEQG
ncbi:hypothetical protein KKI24_18150 [bacterium]|nr:hypothetical protein [bacterium]